MVIIFVPINSIPTTRVLCYGYKIGILNFSWDIGILSNFFLVIVMIRGQLQIILSDLGSQILCLHAAVLSI